MIDVIIPCFNAHKTLDKTLQSIIDQTIKDKVNVLLVDDCSDNTYDSFIDKYNNQLNISVIRLDKNQGPGVSREEGIKATSNKYITFIDSDDYFYSSDSLEQLYNKIIEGYDYVNSFEYDQKRDAYLILNGNVHGKIYRRKFIEDKDIHFINTRYHEDNYFNNLVVLSGAKHFYMDVYTYYYTYNKSSITNYESTELDRLDIYLDNMNKLLIEAEKRNSKKDRLIRFIVDKYRYLRRLYKLIDDKNKFEELISEYDPEFLELLKLSDVDFYIKLLNYTIDYISD